MIFLIVLTIFFVKFPVSGFQSYIIRRGLDFIALPDSTSDFIGNYSADKSRSNPWISSKKDRQICILIDCHNI